MKITKHQNTSILPGALYNPETSNDVDIPLAPEESVTADNLPPSARYIYDKAKEINRREYAEHQRNTDVRFTGEKPLESEDWLIASTLLPGITVDNVIVPIVGKGLSSVAKTRVVKSLLSGVGKLNFKFNRTKFPELVSPDMRKIIWRGVNEDEFTSAVNGKWEGMLPNPSLAAENVNNYENLYGKITLLGDESMLKDAYIYAGDGDTSTAHHLIGIDDIGEVSKRMKQYDDTNEFTKNMRISELDLRRATGRGKHNSWYGEYYEVKPTSPIHISRFKHAFIRKGEMTPQLRETLNRSGIPFTETDGWEGFEIRKFIQDHPEFEFKQGGKLPFYLKYFNYGK